MLTTRFVFGLSALALGGVAVAAIALPAQDAMVQVTKEHGLVTQGVGAFEGAVSMQMPGSAEPARIPCSETVTAVGELWTVSRFEMEYMGQPFAGSAVLGFDPEKKKFVGSWIDAFTPSMTLMEGEWDAEKNAIVMHYEQFDPMVGGMVEMRSEHRVTDSGYTMTFFKIHDGEESQSMKMDMKRKAAVEAGAKK